MLNNKPFRFTFGFMDKKIELKKQSEIIERFIYAFSKCFALYSELLFDHLKSFQNESENKPYLKGLEKKPSLNEWLKLYKDEHLINKTLFQYLEKDTFGLKLPTNDIDPLYDLLSFSQKGFENVAEKDVPNLKDSFYESLKILTEFFNGAPEIYQNILNQREIEDTKVSIDYITLFFFTVYITCFFFYGKTPKEIFEKAQNGSKTDLKNLLRIDPSVLGDPLIFESFHKASMDVDRTTYNEMIKSLGNPPKERMDLSQIKFRTAGLISSASEKVKRKFNTPEIENIFDALSEEFNKEEIKLVLHDPDNPPYEKSIYQRIRRNKLFFE